MSGRSAKTKHNRSTRESGSDTTAPVRKRGEAPLQKEPDNSANEKKQIDLLIKLHSEEEVVDKKFQLELVALKSKFQDLYGELYEDRANVVAGDLSVGHDEDDDDVEKVAPLPKFWLKALLGCEVTKDLISRRDAAILEHLSDIQAKTTVNDEGLPNGFILSFFFSENKYLASEVLVKEYLMDPEDDSLEDTIGCDVKWRRGMNPTVKHVSRNSHPGVVSINSFFEFFSPPEIPGDDESLDSTEEKELQDLLEADYEVGIALREMVIPYALKLFLGLKHEDKIPAPVTKEISRSKIPTKSRSTSGQNTPRAAPRQTAPRDADSTSDSDSESPSPPVARPVRNRRLKKKAAPEPAPAVGCRQQ